MRRQTSLRLKRAMRHMRPSHVVKMRLTHHTIASFAEKVGLVYFGYVDQRDDEHRLIRGHTVSSTHQDNHYCIGAVRTYDVMLALRNDVVRAGASEQRCHWLIYAIDLHTKVDVPHFYIGHRSRDALFAASYSQLRPIALTGRNIYSHRFTSEYTIYGTATHALTIEQIIQPQIAEVIAEHFQAVSIEIEDNTVYLYVESERPKEAQLEKMLSNGLWLAEAIDAQYLAERSVAAA